MTNNYFPYIGGVPISIDRLAHGLIDQGNEVAIFAPSYQGHQETEYPEENLTVYRYRSTERGPAHCYISDGVVIGHAFDRRIQNWLLEFNPDIIHVHHPFLIGSTALHLGKKYQIPVCMTYHTRFEQYLHYFKPVSALEEVSEHAQSEMWRSMQNGAMRLLRKKALPYYIRSFANRCDLVFAPTDSMKEQLTGMGITSPVRILPTGVNSSFFSDKRNGPLREQYIQGRNYLFCTVSRMAEEKNLLFLLRGLSALKEQIGDSFRCLMIGDGPQKKELEEYARRYGVKEQTVFLGAVSNEQIADYYAACDLFVFSSQTETQGIVLLEAMAAGLPVVALQATGSSDVVKDGYNGFLTQADETVWARAIQKALRSPSLRDGARETAGQYRSQMIAGQALLYYRMAVNEYGKMRGYAS